MVSRRELAEREVMARLLDAIADACVDFRSAYEEQAAKLDRLGYGVVDWDELGFASLDVDALRESAREWRE